jgi:hypothetical protein
MKDLIAKAANEQDKHIYFERYVVNQLGRRYEKLTVVNEKGLHQVQAKGVDRKARVEGN